MAKSSGNPPGATPSKSSPDKTGEECFLCEQKGHWARNCPLKDLAKKSVNAVKNTVLLGQYGPLAPPGVPPVAYPSHPGSSTANLNNARTTPSSAYWHPTVNLNYTRGLTAEQLYLQALASKEKSPQAGRAYLGNVRVTEELPLQEPRLSASSRYFLPTFGIITLTLTIFVLLASWWVTPRLLDFLCQTPDGRVPTSKAQSTVYLTSTSPLLDSGALGSHTIAPQDADLLKNLRPTNVLVEGALGAAEVVKTKGNLLLSHKGQSLSINDAIAVSSTKRTLISLPVLADEGKKVLFEGELAAVYPPGTVFTAMIRSLQFFTSFEETRRMGGPFQSARSSKRPQSRFRLKRP